MAISKIKNQNPTQDDMKHSQYRPKNGVKTYIPLYRNSEVWLPITCVPNVQEWYYVSNYGRIYSRLYDCIIRQRFVGRGYCIVTLRLKDNTATDQLVHRLVLQTFNPIPNPEDFQVNHKDAVKTKNHLYNLEWVTCSENMIHAYKNGLYKNGEDNNFAVISNEQAHIICRCLELKYNVKTICDTAGLEYNYKSNGIINQIYKRNNWKHISRNYNF